MRILVLGAYGLIGSHIVARLAADGCEIVGLGRNVAAARRRFPDVVWIERDMRDMRRAADWTPLLYDVHAIVNCAGALQDNPRDDLAAVHVEAPLALAEACVAAGRRRFVHISAMGADAGRKEPFSATKHAFERKLAALDLDWTILRPGLVWSPQAFGGTALLRGLAGFPFATPVVHPDARIQVVAADDLAEIVARALAPDAPARLVCDVAHPEPIALVDLLARIRAWLGLAPAPALRLPTFVPRLAGYIADALAFAGWRSPMRTAALDQLRAGVTGKADEARRLFGFEPKSFGAWLASHPAGVQERVFARLYFAKPLCLAILALFWLASGLIGLIRLDAAAQVLDEAGWSTGAAGAAVVAGALVDILLGIFTIIRRWSRFALLGMIATTLAYLAAASALRPELWLDPLGPLVKTVPAAILALTALAFQDER